MQKVTTDRIDESRQLLINAYNMAKHNTRDMIYSLEPDNLFRNCRHLLNLISKSTDRKDQEMRLSLLISSSTDLLYVYLQNSKLTHSSFEFCNAFNMSLGAYIEQEAKKKDQWRDETFDMLYKHIRHELEEIDRSNTQTKLLHNLMDLNSLAVILYAKFLENDLTV